MVYARATKQTVTELSSGVPTDTSKLFKAVVVIVIADFAGSGGSWAAVMNGDFELPAVTGASGYDYRSGAALTGWTTNSSRGIVQFNASHRPVGGGRQSIQLEFPDDYIEQSITTVINQHYLLSFDLSAYTPPGTSLL